MATGSRVGCVTGKALGSFFNPSTKAATLVYDNRLNCKALIKNGLMHLVAMARSLSKNFEHQIHCLSSDRRRSAEVHRLASCDRAIAAGTGTRPPSDTASNPGEASARRHKDLPARVSGQDPLWVIQPQSHQL